MKAAQLASTFLLIGGTGGSKDIWQYDPGTRGFTVVGEMVTYRVHPAVLPVYASQLQCSP